MHPATLAIIEDDKNVLGIAKLISKKYGLDFKSAETYDEGIALMSQISDVKGTVILCLDGEFPCEQNITGAPGLKLLRECGLQLPNQTFFIPNSAVPDINIEMVHMWTNNLKRDEGTILSDMGKPSALMAGVKDYIARMSL